MKALIRRITSWGIREDTTAEEAAYIRLTNTLLSLMTIASVFETVVCAFAGAFEAALINSTAPLVFGGGLLLMRAGYTLLARLMVLTIGYAAGYTMATVLGPDAEIQLLILFASAISFTFFPLAQWKCISYGLTLPIVCFVLLETTDYRPILGFERTQLSAERLEIIRLATVTGLWAQVIGQFSYLVRSRRRSQERLVSSAKMVALGQMAAGVAHEVNNPLLLIVANAEKLENLAAKGLVPADQAASIADQIQKIAIRIGNIVHGLQTLSRDASSDPFVEIHLRALVDTTLDYCRERIHSRGVKLEVSDIPGHWTVIGREAQLSEVVLNMLNNALDATEKLEERWIRIEARAQGSHVDVLVTDSGQGIPQKLRSRIFDPFFTTKPVGKGTGLGLSVSHGIMTNHRGRIYYDESSPHTRFVMRIPKGRDHARDQGSALT